MFQGGGTRGRGHCRDEEEGDSSDKDTNLLVVLLPLGAGGKVKKSS